MKYDYTHVYGLHDFMVRQKVTEDVSLRPVMETYCGLYNVPKATVQSAALVLGDWGVLTLNERMRFNLNSSNLRKIT
jgi:hypothetical protein